MDSQDTIKMGHKAKSETEAFINRYLDDHAKGWPKNGLVDPAYSGHHQEQPRGMRSNVRMLPTQ